MLRTGEIDIFELLLADLGRQKDEAFRKHDAMIDNETGEVWHERHITRAFDLEDAIKEINIIRRRLHG